MSERVVLDRDDLRRTLVRIAHEIIEKNPRGRRRGARARDRRDPHPRAPCSPAACTRSIAELLGRRRRAARRRRHLLLPRRRGRPRAPPTRPIVHASHLDFDLDRPHGRPRRRRPLHRPHRPRRDRRPLRLRPPAPGPARRPRRPRPPRAADPPRLRGQEPADRPRRARLRPARGGRRGRRGDDRDADAPVAAAPQRRRTARRPEGTHEEPALDRRPRPRGRRADLRARPQLRRGRPPRDQEGPDPARADDRLALLRVEHPDQLLLRARRQAPLRRRHLGQAPPAPRSTRASRCGTRSRRSPPTGRRRSSSARPQAGAAALVAGWTDAAVINAGDGKHEHPSQALLDVYTLLERARARSTASGSGSSATSPTAASPAPASAPSTLMGAEVTVAGPPTLIPRGIEELGCDVSYTLDDLGEADVVYALRMQQERMSDSFVPSLREYAINYQINARRLGPRQLLMHPGPVNRGVELSPEVIDGPNSLITAQVASGLLVRMAILYEILAGSGERPRAGPRAPSPRSSRRRSGSRRERRQRHGSGTSSAIADLDWRGGARAGRGLVIRGAHALDPRSGLDGICDLVIRDGRIAEIAEAGRRRGSRGRRGDRRLRPARLPGLLRPSRPPAHARAGAQGGHRDRHPRRRGRRLLRDRRDGQHRPGRRRPRPRPRAARARRGRGARCRPASSRP